MQTTDTNRPPALRAMLLAETGFPHSRLPLAQPICLYFGPTGEFSIPPLEALLADGLTICGVVMPAPGGLASAAPVIRREPARPFGEQPLREPGSRTLAFGSRAAARRSRLPMLTPYMNRTIAQIAWERAIPVIEVGRLSSAETLETLAALKPDVICVACFPQRLPRTLLDLPRLGCLNVHPSLLPAYRGPSPGYWVLRNGERATGVTIHLMDEQLDSGDILLQQAFEIPPGITASALEQQCAVLGGPLLARAVRALAAGTATRTKQDPAQASYYSWPDEQ